MSSEYDDFLAGVLRGYVRLVTGQLGFRPERGYVQATTAYLELDGRLPGFPDREVALLWDDRGGWAAAVETHIGEDLILQAWFGAKSFPGRGRWPGGRVRC
ncbi:DUF6292 family protein [Saccharothrix sp. S26]|uniref:DUF6292 family protein n=1 Tax=Saccharothrix sp. S26 TaxID=2907215 RepID=UPI001F42B745|nr:DUF6292 family protein [Saccharothrix sp. S26]MCE6995469.1 DUF6292 family protein [Saccharothrix sp. S26]